MKKKFIITVLGVSAVLAAAAVHAQTASSMPSAAAPATSMTPSPAAKIDRAADPALFNLHKKKQLDSINEHLVKMRKRQACIQAAENEKALSACSGVISEAMHPAAAAKIAPAAATTAPIPAAPASATATLPRSVPATLPATTPATPVKP